MPNATIEQGVRFTDLFERPRYVRLDEPDASLNSGSGAAKGRRRRRLSFPPGDLESRQPYRDSGR